MKAAVRRTGISGPFPAQACLVCNILLLLLLFLFLIEISQTLGSSQIQIACELESGRGWIASIFPKRRNAVLFCNEVQSLGEKGPFSKSFWLSVFDLRLMFPLPAVLCLGVSFYLRPRSWAMCPQNLALR